MTKENIFNQMQVLVKKSIENKNVKLTAFHVSPYKPLIVIECVKKISNTEGNRNLYTDYYLTLCERFMHATELMHYQVSEFEGLERLYNKYLNTN